MKIKDMAIEAAAKINEDRCGSYVRGYMDGAKAIVKEIESLMDRDNCLAVAPRYSWQELVKKGKRILND